MTTKILAKLERDQEGYLNNPTAWDLEIANLIAAEENIHLSEEHILILNLMREYFFKFAMSPGMRPLVAALKSHYGADKGNSTYLHLLFPNGPAKQASKIAGLPKPVRCM
jgi:tRNA 2-thiouridine synthesizing protein E